MKSLLPPASALAVPLLLALLPVLSAQSPANPAATTASIEANRKALSALFEDYWQDQL
jgi:hypothetical protein